MVILWHEGVKSRMLWQDQVETQNICELFLLKIILDLKIQWNESMRLYSENKAAINITRSPVSHDRMKHIEID